MYSPVPSRNVHPLQKYWLRSVFFFFHMSRFAQILKALVKGSLLLTGICLVYFCLIALNFVSANYCALKSSCMQNHVGWPSPINNKIHDAGVRDMSHGWCDKWWCVTFKEIHICTEVNIISYFSFNICLMVGNVCHAWYMFDNGGTDEYYPVDDSMLGAPSHSSH